MLLLIDLNVFSFKSASRLSPLMAFTIASSFSGDLLHSSFKDLNCASVIPKSAPLPAFHCPPNTKSFIRSASSAILRSSLTDFSEVSLKSSVIAVVVLEYSPSSSANSLFILFRASRWNWTGSSAMVFSHFSAIAMRF
ncbi:hypothetical protein SDC9_179433 [bioreactor metagenome]|uniref:Uncharacterized protein n=1 Tax=bioreactor metagenome TaxID=1076179 RepID=A0A645GYY7_9ZZZZ